MLSHNARENTPVMCHVVNDQESYDYSDNDGVSTGLGLGLPPKLPIWIEQSLAHGILKTFYISKKNYEQKAIF